MFAPWSIVILLLSEALIVVTCYVAAIAYFIDGDIGLYLTDENGAGRVAIVALSILFGLYFVDLYSRVYSRSRIWLVQQISLVIGSAFLLQAFLSYASRNLILPKWVMIGGSLLAFLGLTVWRLIYAKILTEAVPRERVLMIGLSPGMEELSAELMDRPELGADLAGGVGEKEEIEAAGLPWLGVIGDMSAIVEKVQPNRLIISPREHEHELPYADLLQYRMKGIIIEESAIAFERTFGRILIDDMTAREFLFGGRLGAGPLLSKLQAFYSIVLSIIGIIITSPIMIFAAIGVKLTSPGPIFFKQNRVGLNGRVFQVWKFRSMYVNVDPFTGPKGRDPRITPLGWYLRKLRIDELPQFFNVLRGEMLVVGPRPEIPEFTRVFIEKIPVYQQRLLVKPGITGWAQINHKVEENLEDTVRKLGYDLYYLKYTSLALDLYVIFHTAKIMLLSRGAR